jgi:hypothetical protein
LPWSQKDHTNQSDQEQETVNAQHRVKEALVRVKATLFSSVEPVTDA